MPSKHPKTHKPRTAPPPSAAQALATFEQALALHQQGRLAEARQHYEEVLAVLPGHFDALHLLGVIAAQTNDNRRAVELIGKAIAIYPGNAAFYSNRGNALQALGQFGDAVESYDRALALQSGYADAWNNRGNALKRLGRLDEAAEDYGRAIAIQPDYADACNNRGDTLRELGRLDPAVEDYNRVIALRPDCAEAFFNRAIALKGLGRPEEAAESYDRAVAIRPDYAEAHNNRGNILRDLGRLDEAIASYSRAVAFRPDYADAWYNRAIALQALGRFDEAVEDYRRIMDLRPDHADACYNCGIALKELGRLDEALASYNRAIDIRPGHAQACFNRANTLQQLGRFDEAVASYNQAVALRPAYAEAYANCGNALKELGRLDKAIASYNRAIALRPDYAEAYSNRGNALKGILKFDEAVASYNQAVAIRPDYTDAWYNRGVALLELGQLDEAIASYNRAIAIRPGYADACWNKSLALLLAGRFAEGWALYEWRWALESLPSPRRDFPQPLWLGKEPLAGKTILLHSEQGWGDTIQFCRYARLVAALGARVVLEVDPPLEALLKGLEGVSAIALKGAALPPPFDYHCPLLSLPLAFQTELDTIPNPRAYLAADAGLRAKWAQRLGEKTRPRIGLVWSGRATHTNDRNRSVALGGLMAHLPSECQYVSLQREVRDADRAVLEAHGEILHFGEELRDFAETAALCELMDIVISVDTSVAHLAAALGREVWVLLPKNPDWRWLMDRNDSPWYPTGPALPAGTDGRLGGCLRTDRGGPAGPGKGMVDGWYERSPHQGVILRPSRASMTSPL